MEILKVEKITLGVFTNNPGAHYCYQAAGFQEVPQRHIYTIMGEEWECIEMEVVVSI